MALAFSGCRSAGFTAAGPVVIEGFSSPESVIKGPGGKYFLVSNVGERLEPSKKDGDGFISAVSPDGRVIDRRFLPLAGELNAPKGMALIGSTLYVTDIDRVVGFDLDTLEQVFELDFSKEGTVFLNDLAVKDDKTLFVSATDIAKVFRITLGAKPSYVPLNRNVAGANGLLYDPRTFTLYINGFSTNPKRGGEVWRVTFDQPEEKFERILEDVGALDGIAKTKSEVLIISDWGLGGRPSRLITYDLIAGAFRVMQLPVKTTGPADFLLDRDTGNIWLPMMPEGKVAVFNTR